MTRPNITLGPWSLQEKRKGGFWIDSTPENAEPEEIALASTSTMPVKQAEANARAIAAVPALLGALEHLANDQEVGFIARSALTAAGYQF